MLVSMLTSCSIENKETANNLVVKSITFKDLSYHPYYLYSCQIIDRIDNDIVLSNDQQEHFDSCKNQTLYFLSDNRYKTDEMLEVCLLDFFSSKDEINLEEKTSYSTNSIEDAVAIKVIAVEKNWAINIQEKEDTFLVELYDCSDNYTSTGSNYLLRKYPRISTDKDLLSSMVSKQNVESVKENFYIYYYN